MTRTFLNLAPIPGPRSEIPALFREINHLPRVDCLTQLPKKKPHSSESPPVLAGFVLGIGQIIQMK